MHDISGYIFWLKKFLIYTVNSECLKFTKMSHFEFLCEFWENVNLEKCELGNVAQCLKITQKSRVQYCERRELRLHFEWTKVNKK